MRPEVSQVSGRLNSWRPARVGGHRHGRGRGSSRCAMRRLRAAMNRPSPSWCARATLDPCARTRLTAVRSLVRRQSSCGCTPSRARSSAWPFCGVRARPFRSSVRNPRSSALQHTVGGRRPVARAGLCVGSPELWLLQRAPAGYRPRPDRTATHRPRDRSTLARPPPHAHRTALRPTRFGKLEAFPGEFFDRTTLWVLPHDPSTTPHRKNTTLFF